MGLPQVPYRGTHLELAGQPLGSAEPPTDVRLSKTAETVKLSSKLFLLSADDTLHALASTAFMRMLQQEDLARVPDFAGQRVRQASVVVQVVDGTPSRMVHSTFSILNIKADGFLDVDCLNNQQIARLDVRFRRLGSIDGRMPPRQAPCLRSRPDLVERQLTGAASNLRSRCSAAAQACVVIGSNGAEVQVRQNEQQPFGCPRTTIWGAASDGVRACI